MTHQTGSVKKGLFKSLLIPIAAIVIVVAVIAAVILHSQSLQYSAYLDAQALLEQREYAEARQAFEALGDYEDAARQMEKAEKGLVYLDAQELLEQGQYREALALYETIGDFDDTQDKIQETKYLLAVELMEKSEWKEARDLLVQTGSFRDTEALLEQLTNEIGYDQAWAYMVTERYDKAAEEFLALGDFRDAAEKAKECQQLGELKETYEEGLWLFNNCKWLEAYRTLSSIRDAEYEDTLSILEEIATVAEERVRLYAEQGERGKLLAFLQLAEEIDAAAGSALRQELAPTETFEADLSYYQFDPMCLTTCTSYTSAERYTSTLLYMILNGETNLTLTSASKLDKATTLGQFYRAQNILGEIIPGCGLIYDFEASVQERSIEITLEYVETYSEERIEQLIETYETFCEESVRDLVESGLLSASMSRKEKAEIISEWLGFYLTYDKMLEIRIAGIAVEEAKGVCSAYAALYHRMCNLAGVPTYGHRGYAGEAHIWLIHVDEAGNIFYADPTWADFWDIDFSKEAEKPTVADFAQKYLERCMEGAVREYRYPNSNDRTGRQYLWARSLWIDHESDRKAEDIIAMHQKLLARNP